MDRFFLTLGAGALILVLQGGAAPAGAAEGDLPAAEEGAAEDTAIDPAPLAEGPAPAAEEAQAVPAPPPPQAVVFNASDKVWLKNGQIIEGRILSESGGNVWIEAAPGSRVLLAAPEIREVSRGAEGNAK